MTLFGNYKIHEQTTKLLFFNFPFDFHNFFNKTNELTLFEIFIAILLPIT